MMCITVRSKAGLSMMNLTLMWLPVNWATRNMCSKPSRMR